MKSLLGIFLSVTGCFWPLSAKVFYVAGNGSDTNDGLSASAAFRTIQKAADQVDPGDTVWVMNGTYTNARPGDSVVDLERSGTRSAWITFKAYPGHHPLVSFDGWEAFNSMQASYIEINGFTIVGNSDHLTYDQAYRQRNISDPLCNGSGISIDGRHQKNFPHHYRILNNTVCQCPGGGIDFCQSDYMSIQNNTVFANGWYTRYAESGISTYQDRNFDQAGGYHNIISGNIVYNNRGLIPWSVTGKFSDGNGIIIDDSKNTQNGSTAGPYTGRTLVTNNLSIGNGGSGIHTYASEHVDIVNNTTWHNSQKLDYGEIFAESSDDIAILNNLCVADRDKPINQNNHNTRVTWDYNLLYGGKAPVVEGGHALRQDPLFVDPRPDPTRGDFRLQPGSPAIDSGTATLAPSTDITGAPRPAGKGFDRGAYEMPE